jgi:hypothetical protein
MANYPKLSKSYLIVDDCCNNIPMPDGYFSGIAPVTKAVNEWEEEQTEFELMFNVVHNKLYGKK